MSDDKRPDHYPEDEPTRELGWVEPSEPSDPTPTPTSLPAMIGPFRIIGKLGEGGMGVVYEAEQEHPRRRVALKVVRAGAFASEHQLRSFEREADMLARLKHPGIAAIHQLGETEDGQPYLVMELVPGRPLDEYLREQPAVTNRAQLEERLALFRQICDAVHYAHQRGVIHRDLKPGNILVVEESPGETSSASISSTIQTQVKILDFGIARITDSDASRFTEVGVIKGTLQYMSPEQTRGEPDEVDIRADVYALGAVLYEVLSGRRPYNLESEAIAEAIRIICEKTPEPLASTWTAAYRPDADIETIVGKALEKEPDRRYASVAAMSEDLERYLSSQPILARPPSASYQLRKMISRHRAIFGVAAAAAVLIVAASIISTVLYFRAEESAKRARVEAEKSEEVANFMTDMLAGVGPAAARGRDTTMLREILDETLIRIDDELESSPEVARVLQSNIAETFFSLSEVEEAERLYRAAIEKGIATAGEEDPATLRDRNSLAIVLTNLGEMEQAESIFSDVLERRRKVLGPDDPEVAATLMNAANLFVRQGRYDEAQPMFTEAIEILRGRFPEGDHNLGIALNSLGNLHHSLRQLDEAEALYNEALEMHTSLLGPDHPDVLVDRHNLAYLYRNRGDYETAEKLFLEIFEEQKRILGEDHRDLSTTLGSIGGVRLSAGDFKGAEGWYRKSLELIERVEGKDSENYARRLNDIGAALSNQGRNEEAVSALEESIERQVRLLGEDSDAVAITRGVLSSVFISLDRLDDASEQLNESLRVMRKIFGNDHSETLVVLNDLGRLQQKMGKLDLAEQTLRDVLEVRERTLGEKSALTARSQYDLGMFLIDEGSEAEIRDGEEWVAKSIDTYIAARGETYPAVPIIRFRLGRHFAARREYATAEPLMIAGHEGLLAAYGEEHPNTVKAKDELAQMYKDWGKTP